MADPSEPSMTLPSHNPADAPAPPQRLPPRNPVPSPHSQNGLRAPNGPANGRRRYSGQLTHPLGSPHSSSRRPSLSYDECKGGEPYHREKFHLAYLTSCPLIRRQTTSTGVKCIPIDKLDVQTELGLLRRCLRDSGKAMKIRREIATSRNLGSIVAHGCRALHYSGHGYAKTLAFEDGHGAMHSLSQNALRELVSTEHGQARGLDFVFVSACRSEDAGRAFALAGVPHVVAVRWDQNVSDNASKIFFESFYQNLLLGHTVQRSFNMAKTTVKHAPTNVFNEGEHFLLLPNDGNHEVAIFSDIPDGNWIDFTPDLPKQTLPPIPDGFVGRQVETQFVFTLVLQHRLVTLTGDSGIGKSSVVIAVAHYLHERNPGYDMVYLISLSPKLLDPSKPKSMGYVCSKYIGTQFMPECGGNEEFYRLVGNQKILFILDGAEQFDAYPEDHELNVCTFLNDLFWKCKGVHVLVGSAHAVNSRKHPLRHVSEKIATLAHLKPKSAADVFRRRAPRSLRLEEISPNCTQETVLACLSKHEVLNFLGGNPRRICEAVAFLQYETMTTLLHRLKLEVKKRQKEQQQRAAKPEHSSPRRRPDVGPTARYAPAFPQDRRNPGHQRNPSHPSAAFDGAAPPRPGLQSTGPSYPPMQPMHQRRQPPTSEPHPHRPSSVHGGQYGGGGGGRFQQPHQQHPQHIRPQHPQRQQPVEEPAHSSNDYNQLSRDGKQLWTGLTATTRPVPFDLLSHHLKNYFLKKTGQQQRNIEESEISYISMKLKQYDPENSISATQDGSGEYVTLKAFARFWPWFEGFAKVIKSIAKLWVMTDPLSVYGLISKQHAKDALDSNDPGTFILRFSDSRIGHIAIAYKDPKGDIQNSLVDATKETGFSIIVDGQESYVYATLEELILKVHPLKSVFQPEGSTVPKEELFSGDEEEPF